MIILLLKGKDMIKKRKKNKFLNFLFLSINKVFWLCSIVMMRNDETLKKG